MSDSYGEAREELGRMLERREILDQILTLIDTTRMLRNKLPVGSAERTYFTNTIDAFMHVAQGIQRRDEK